MINIFILAGGFGTRLTSVVKDVPKPMAPIEKKPFLDYQIEHLRSYLPDSKIYLLTHYMSEVIEAYYKNLNNIFILKEETPLGTGGSIKNAILKNGLQKDEKLLILNGDTFLEMDFNCMLKESCYPINILGSFQNNCDRYGSFELKDEKIIQMNEKVIGTRDSYINAGCYYFQNLNFFYEINEDIFAIEDKFKSYLESNEIGIIKYKGIFIDIGIPSDYEKMKEYIRDENRRDKKI